MAALLLENLILFTITVVSILKQRRAAQYAVDQSYRSTDAADMASKTAALERLQQDGGLHQQENETDTPPKRTNSAKKTKKKQKVRFILYIKLGLIMGLGWIFAFAAALVNLLSFYVIERRSLKLTFFSNNSRQKFLFYGTLSSYSMHYKAPIFSSLSIVNEKFTLCFTIGLPSILIRPTLRPAAADI